MPLSFQPLNWWLIISGAAATLILFWSLWRALFLKKDTRLLFILRVLVFLLIFFILFQPVSRRSEEKREKVCLGVLIDSSASMNLPDPVSRLEQVKNFIRQGGLSSLGKTAVLKFYEFADTCSAIDEEQLNRLKPRGPSTDLAAALEKVYFQLKEDNLAGLVLFSDGNHNTSSDPLYTVTKLDLPVWSLGTGRPQKIPDLGVLEVKSPDFGFKGSEVKISALISGEGFSGQEIKVLLEDEEGNSLQIKKIVLTREPESVDFKYIPREVGKFTYKITVPGYSREAFLQNNSQKFSLTVLREKIRVLYICGQPGWEYRFLRDSLKNDPSIELVSFVILRNPENLAVVPDNQLSLIPFPAEEMFLQRKLEDFDILIFENFTYRKFFSYQYLENIKRFVEQKGGGFLMMGGEDAFGRGNYRSTPLADILPVNLEDNERLETGQFKMRAEKVEHPILEVGDSSLEAEKVWQEMPELDGCNVLGEAKPSALVLAVHPWVRNRQGNSPVLAVWKKGKGRVVALATNTTWRWSMGLGEKGKTSYYYHRFWHQVVRWLVDAPQLKLATLKTDKNRYLKGEEIGLEVRTRDEYYRPVSADLDLSLVTPSQKRMKWEGLFNPEPGLYQTRVKAEEEGRYNFKVYAQKNDRFLGKDETFCEVVVPTLEFSRASLNEEILQKISSLSGGKYFLLAELKDKELKIPLQTRRERTEKTIPVWESVYFYLLLVGFSALEWFLRRRQGLP